jgi:hypothetical protein
LVLANDVNLLDDDIRRVEINSDLFLNAYKDILIRETSFMEEGSH